MEKIGLVLEGGGMKGLYTTGVLDYFLEKDLSFESIYSVSAGACMMTNYVSKQKGRGRDVFVDYIGEKHVMGMYSLLTTGDMFGADINYNLIPNYINLFDYESFSKYEGNAYSVVTDIDTGKAEYVKITDLKTQVDYIRASSSLPLISRVVKIDGKRYMDGGLADPLPVRKALEDGYDKIVLVMTKPIGYRRKKESSLPLIKLRYGAKSKIYELVKFRHIRYNETLDYIDELVKTGKVFLIQPKEELEVERIEKDREKLLALYDEGYREAKETYDSLMEFIRK